MHLHHPSWIYSTPTHSKWWAGSQRCIRYDPAKACNLIRVGKSSHSTGTQKGIWFCAKTGDTKSNCFKNSEKELGKKKRQLSGAGKSWVGPEWTLNFK